MRPLDGYPTSWGSSRASVFPHAGPASYEQIGIESPFDPVPIAGGDLVEAVEAGLKYFDFVTGSFSDTARYFIRSVPTAISSNMNGAAQENYRLVWYVTATGAEVAAEVDLSDEVVRLLGVGPK